METSMGSSDVFFVGVDRSNPTNAATTDLRAEDQNKNSAFLTVQSFANFTAAAGAISTAWLALRALDAEQYQSKYWPLLLCFAWLIVSLVTSYQAGAASP